MFKGASGSGKAPATALPEGCQAWEHEHIGGQGMVWPVFELRLKTIGDSGWEMVASFVDAKGNPHAMFKRPRQQP